ncbi:hypothetical protein K491DRAFT_720319 [Lophiostoma macrostomum CBS 122681]|uniref:AA1-like domain-containing protein n=1 Tax=Lophiostoma macrostomum CBS 122681 TaxID=1314788 RepID=A0A6A6SWF7_9PLEO|nr:hypothetical protein K491DRAFT_720319 [Lophiostoma macrostomum CBS 122681]
MLAPIFAALSFSSLALSAALDRRVDDTAIWPVTELNVHYSDNNSSASTLEFIVEWSRGTATCATSFPFNQLPTNNIYCDETARNPSFNLTATKDGIFNETAFTLNVKGSVRITTQMSHLYKATQEILANSPGSADEYLECTDQADGVQCGLAKPLNLTAEYTNPYTSA